MTESAKKITTESSGNISPNTSNEFSLSSSSDSSSSIMSSASSVPSSLKFFLFSSKSRPDSDNKQKESSSFREKCAVLSKQLTDAQKNCLPILIIAASVDEEVAIKMCDETFLSKMDDVDLSYLKTFVKPFTEQQKIKKQLYERIRIAPLSVTENNIDECARTYFTIKMKMVIPFVADVITSALLQKLLDDFDVQFCIKLAEEICTLREPGEGLLKLICDNGQWDNMCSQRSRIIIINLIYNLIEKHQFIPDFLLNESLLGLYTEEEFSSLASLIRKYSLQATITEMLLNLIRRNIVIVRNLSDPERSYRMSRLINEFIDARDFVQEMKAHFNSCIEAIAVVFSKTGFIGYRKAVERLITQSERDAYIVKLREWFSYDFMTSDASTFRALLAGDKLAKEHERKASNSNYLFLTQFSVDNNFEMTAGTIRTNIKHKFVPVHRELAQLFEQTFLPHIEECLANLCETRAAYYKIMIYNLISNVSEACNPQNYQLKLFPKEMRKYFEAQQKKIHAEILIKMQLIYLEKMAFERRYEQDKQAMKVEGYESLSNIAKTIVGLKVPVEIAQHVKNLDEFTEKIKLLFDDILKNSKIKLLEDAIQDNKQVNIPEIISQYPFNLQQDLYLHNDLYNDFLKMLLQTTSVSKGKILIANEKELKNELKILVQGSITKKLAPPNVQPTSSPRP